jgi:phenylacetate-CoA ligase
MDHAVRYRRHDAFERHDAPYWNPIEAAPPSEWRALQERKLREQMAYLQARSTFYREKFAAAGIGFNDIRTIADLEKVPFTYKDEIRQSLKGEPPFDKHRAADLSDIIQLQASSGTTSSPSYVALTQPDAEMWHELSARGFFAGGIRPGDLVLHAFSMSKGFVGGVPLLQGLQYMGAIDIPIGADGGIDRLLRAAMDLKPRCIVGTPNFVLHLAAQTRDTLGVDARALGVKRLIVGGEPGGGIPSLRTALQDAWGAKCCELLGGTDIGVIYWGECDEQAGMHMQCMDYIIVELLNAATERVIQFQTGATGELVYTAIGRQASPLVRFRSGDHVEVLGTSCACGRTGPKIRCVGRTDDMLIVRGVNVFPSAIQSIVAEMQPRTNGVMRIYADFEGHTTQRNLKVYVERGPATAPEAVAALKQEVETRLRNALAFKADAIVVPPDSFEKPGVQKVALTVRSEPRVKAQ